MYVVVLLLELIFCPIFFPLCVYSICCLYVKDTLEDGLLSDQVRVMNAKSLGIGHPRNDASLHNP